MLLGENAKSGPKTQSYMTVWAGRRLILTSRGENPGRHLAAEILLDLALCSFSLAWFECASFCSTTVVMIERYFLASVTPSLMNISQRGPRETFTLHPD